MFALIYLFIEEWLLLAITQEFSSNIFGVCFHLHKHNGVF